jgi:hypothetical protein
MTSKSDYISCDSQAYQSLILDVIMIKRYIEYKIVEGRKPEMYFDLNIPVNKWEK